MYIDKNYRFIVLGDYIEHQEVHIIDKQFQFHPSAEAESAASPSAAKAEWSGAHSSTCLSERVQRLFLAAQKRGLMEPVPGGYIWKENNTLLDYFLGRTFCGDYPGPAGKYGERPIWYYGEKNAPLPAAELNRLFGRTNIGVTRRKRHLEPVPDKHEVVDEIF